MYVFINLNKYATDSFSPTFNTIVRYHTEKVWKQISFSFFSTWVSFSQHVTMMAVAFLLRNYDLQAASFSLKQ